MCCGAEQGKGHDQCVRRPNAPHCPFNCNLDCAAFSCASVGIRMARKDSSYQMSMAMAVRGRNATSNSRITRLCFQSSMDDFAAPTGRLQTFDHVRLGTNRSQRMAFALSGGSLTLCVRRKR